MAFHLNSPWGLEADLRKFQLDRLMCNVEQELIFAPRVWIGQDDGRSILHVSSPGDVHTGEVTLRKNRSLSPELGLKVESKKKKKKESRAPVLPSIPIY